MFDVYVCIYKQASTQDYGVWGCSPRKYLEIRCSEIASGVIFGQKKSLSSYYFIQLLAVLHAFGAGPLGTNLPSCKQTCLDSGIIHNSMQLDY